MEEGNARPGFLKVVGMMSVSMFVYMLLVCIVLFVSIEALILMGFDIGTALRTTSQLVWG